MEVFSQDENFAENESDQSFQPTRKRGELFTEEQARQLSRILGDPSAAHKLLPPEEQEEYRKAQQSVVDARNQAQRQAGETWIF